MDPSKYFQYREPNPPVNISPTRDTRADLGDLIDLTNHSQGPKKFLKRRPIIRDEIGKASIQHPGLLEQRYLQPLWAANAWQLYNDVRATMHPGPRWNLMPEFPKDEEEVRKAFMDIVRELKTQWSGGYVGDVIDTHKNSVTGSRDGSTLRPDIFFTQGATPSDKSPHWSSCVVAAEAKKKKAKSGPDTFGQLGSYAEQIFSTQENRRFVPSFVVDEWVVRFFIFDRGGAISGQTIEYHTDPWKLCALVQNFLFFQGPDTGFDPSVYYEDSFTYIQTTVDPEENLGGPVPTSQRPGT